MVASVPSTSHQPQQTSRDNRDFPIPSPSGNQGSFSQETAVKGAQPKSCISAYASGRGSRAAEKDTRRRQKAIEKEMAKAEKAAKLQGSGNAPQGGAVISHPFEEQPLQPCNITNLSQPACYHAWSPDGARELLSPISMETFGNAEVFTNADSNLSVCNRYRKPSSSLEVKANP